MAFTNENRLRWFALQVRPRSEKIVASILRAKGYGEFLPLHTARRRWSDRTKELEIPLFPGYLFCRLDPLVRLPVLITPGVIAIVGVGRNPVPVEDSEIDAIHSIVQSEAGAEPWPYLQTGQKVQIDRGPLTGLEGILVACKKSQKLVVSVSLLQRSVAVEIHRGWVIPGRSAARPCPAPLAAGPQLA